jgi:hypothetical protein
MTPRCRLTRPPHLRAAQSLRRVGRAALGRLAREYRDRGREADAQTIEQRLRRLLELADDTHPLVRSLRHAAQ